MSSHQHLVGIETWSDPALSQYYVNLGAELQLARESNDREFRVYLLVEHQLVRQELDRRTGVLELPF